MKRFLEIVLDYQAFPKGIDLWEFCELSKYLTELEQLQKIRCTDTGRNIQVKNLNNHMIKTKLDSFRLRKFDLHPKEHVYISFVNLLNEFGRFDVIGFEQLIEHWQVWLPKLLKHPSFVQARIGFYDYDRQQNWDDLYFYEREGIDHSHLPKVDNGKPFPINQIVVDTSSNPGHWELRDDYIYGVGAMMWLGEHFFQRVNLDKQQVLDANWLEAEDCGEYVQIKAYPALFNSADGEQGELQHKLKALLFANANE
ncbi:hypothetical protein HR060_01530 [Catenovulum sp. SM1970]|uniref:hypothetical protein n=1 Tax=Marinifaba aquimaris TaxID=2741323 RepID=UPI0015730374|nr:hypothetical protein [Marinifaba aquimaris]NTS75534.1 hypothetical protein [Marinifaba aquimaris]